jgi:hypothetical protein
MDESEDAIFDQVERQYMPGVLAKVKARAVELAAIEERKEPSYVDTFRAFEDQFGGKTTGLAVVPERVSLLKDNLFIIIVVVMTLGFGFMGLAPYLFSVAPDRLGYKPDNFLDIAKLFAGVVVGGAAGAAAGSATARRGGRER